MSCFAVSWGVPASASVIFSTDFAPPVYQCCKQGTPSYTQGAKSHTESAIFMGRICGVSVHSF